MSNSKKTQTRSRGSDPFVHRNQKPFVIGLRELLESMQNVPSGQKKSTLDQRANSPTSNSSANSGNSVSRLSQLFDGLFRSNSKQGHNRYPASNMPISRRSPDSVSLNSNSKKGYRDTRYFLTDTKRRRRANYLLLKHSTAMRRSWQSLYSPTMNGGTRRSVPVSAPNQPPPQPQPALVAQPANAYVIQSDKQLEHKEGETGVVDRACEERVISMPLQQDATRSGAAITTTPKLAECEITVEDEPEEIVVTFKNGQAAALVGPDHPLANEIIRVTVKKLVLPHDEICRVVTQDNGPRVGSPMSLSQSDAGSFSPGSSSTDTESTTSTTRGILKTDRHSRSGSPSGSRIRSHSVGFSRKVTFAEEQTAFPITTSPPMQRRDLLSTESPSGDSSPTAEMRKGPFSVTRTELLEEITRITSSYVS